MSSCSCRCSSNSGFHRAQRVCVVIDACSQLDMLQLARLTAAPIRQVARCRALPLRELVQLSNRCVSASSSQTQTETGDKDAALAQLAAGILVKTDAKLLKAGREEFLRTSSFQ